MTYDVTCLYSIVRNVSGRRMTFGFLPPHGRTLDANEEFSVWGDVRQAVIKGERTESRRNIQGLENALSRSPRLLEIISTPSPVLYDATLDGSYNITLDNGSLGVADVCWHESASV